MKYSKALFFLLFVILSCAANSSKNKTKYKFPQKSVISAIPEKCSTPIQQPMKKLGSIFDDFVEDNFSVGFTAIEEADFGKEMKSVMDKEHKYFPDNENDVLKIREILNKIKHHTSRNEVDYTAYLLTDNTTINAWTHSGGYIYITKALFDQVESDDELAFIIAHEVAHNENHHCDKVLKRIKAATQISGDRQLGSVIYSMMQYVLAGFDQYQEIESDLGAVYLTYMAGFDPALGQRFFERLSEKEDVSNFGRLFNSHPYSQDRQKCVQEYLNSAKLN
jgi:predicted Zn-dependent protease